MIICTIEICDRTSLFAMILNANEQENPMRLRLPK